jgi:hypothetical protein
MAQEPMPDSFSSFAYPPIQSRGSKRWKKDRNIDQCEWDIIVVPNTTHAGFQARSVIRGDGEEGVKYEERDGENPRLGATEDDW